jgi:PDZ domain-containing protein
MKNLKRSLLALGLICMIASLAYAQAPPPPPKAKTKVMTVVGSDDDGEKNLRIEIKKKDDLNLVKVWETRDGEDVLVKEFETDDLDELHEELGEYNVYFHDDDDDNTFFYSRGKAGKHGKHIQKWIKDGKAPHMEFFGQPRAWLGVGMQDLNEQLGDYFDVKDGQGTLVESVIEDSPAEKTGIKAGDVIIRMDELDIEGSGDVIEFVRGKEIGDEIEVTVKRKGKKKTFKVELGERETEDLAWSMHDDDNVWSMRTPKALKRYRMAPDTDHEILLERLHEDGNSEKIEEMRADIEEIKALLEELRNEQK